jgi:hypothetical protein
LERKRRRQREFGRDLPKKMWKMITSRYFWELDRKRIYERDRTDMKQTLKELECRKKVQNTRKQIEKDYFMPKAIGVKKRSRNQKEKRFIPKEIMKWSKIDRNLIEKRMKEIKEKKKEKPD